MTHSIPIYKLRLVRDHVAVFPEPALDMPKACAAFFGKLIGGADREHFAALFLDALNKPTGATIVGIGTLTETRLHVREVFKGAVVANAHKVVVAHNHPADCPTPSADDLRCTKSLVEAGKLLGIPVVDHIIVTPSGAFRSMCESGLLREAA